MHGRGGTSVRPSRAGPACSRSSGIILSGTASEEVGHIGDVTDVRMCRAALQRVRPKKVAGDGGRTRQVHEGRVGGHDHHGMLGKHGQHQERLHAAGDLGQHRRRELVLGRGPQRAVALCASVVRFP